MEVNVSRNHQGEGERQRAPRGPDGATASRAEGHRRVTNVLPVPAAAPGTLRTAPSAGTGVPSPDRDTPRPPWGPTCDDQLCGVLGAPVLVFREAGVNAGVCFGHVGYLEPPVFQEGNSEGNRNQTDQWGRHGFYQTSSSFLAEKEERAWPWHCSAGPRSLTK